jgi:hypothetical protein
MGETPAILGQHKTMRVTSTYYRITDPDEKIKGIQVDRLEDGRIITITEMPTWPFIMMPRWDGSKP